MLSADYNTFMDVHQAVLLEIVRRFRREGIDFAYPTRALHVAGLKEILGAASVPERTPLRTSDAQAARRA